MSETNSSAGENNATGGANDSSNTSDVASAAASAAAAVADFAGQISNAVSETLQGTPANTPGGVAGLVGGAIAAAVSKGPSGLVGHFATAVLNDIIQNARYSGRSSLLANDSPVGRLLSGLGDVAGNLTDVRNFNGLPSGWDQFEQLTQSGIEIQQRLLETGTLLPSDIKNFS